MDVTVNFFYFQFDMKMFNMNSVVNNNCLVKSDIVSALVAEKLYHIMSNFSSTEQVITWSRD